MNRRRCIRPSHPVEAFAATLPTRPCRHRQDHRRAVRTGDRADLDGQRFGQRRRQFGKAPKNRSGFREAIDQHAGDDVWQLVEMNVHFRHDAKISAAATLGPEQILFVTRLGGDHTPIGEYNVGSDQVVERKTEAADQWPIAAAQCEFGYADRAARTRHDGEAKRIGHREDIDGAGTCGDARAAPVGLTCTSLKPLRSSTSPLHSARPAERAAAITSLTSK